MKNLVNERSKSLASGALVLVLVGAAACAAKFPPPAELVEARAAYGRASSGPAQQLAPARLRLAKQALDSAEMSYGAAPENEVRDRAYVAVRRAEAAEAEAATVAARNRRERALRELASLSGVHAERARAELAAAGQRADQASQEAMSERQRANEQQMRADQASTSLEAERQARAQAEVRARQALAELERLANVKREARGLVITLSGQVLFVTNEATLLPAARTSLDSVAAALKGAARQGEAPAEKIVIEGHTDATGSRGYNMELSERRAQSVRDYLVGQGVPGDRLVVKGLGPDRPVASNGTTEGRANNRRVEIVIPQSAALAQIPGSGSAPSGDLLGSGAGTSAGATGASTSATGTSGTATGSTSTPPVTAVNPSGSATATGTTGTPSSPSPASIVPSSASSGTPPAPASSSPSSAGSVPPSSTTPPSTLQPPPGSVSPPPTSVPTPGTSGSVPAPAAGAPGTVSPSPTRSPTTP